MTLQHRRNALITLDVLQIGQNPDRRGCRDTALKTFYILAKVFQWSPLVVIAERRFSSERCIHSQGLQFCLQSDRVLGALENSDCGRGSKLEEQATDPLRAGGKLTRSSALRRDNSSGFVSTAGCSGGSVEEVRNVSNPARSVAPETQPRHSATDRSSHCKAFRGPPWRDSSPKRLSIFLLLASCSQERRGNSDQIRNSSDYERGDLKDGTVGKPAVDASTLGVASSTR